MPTAENVGKWVSGRQKHTRESRSRFTEISTCGNWKNDTEDTVNKFTRYDGKLAAFAGTDEPNWITTRQDRRDRDIAPAGLENTYEYDF